MHNMTQGGTKFVSRDWKPSIKAQGFSDTRYTANRMLCVVNRQSCIPLDRYYSGVARVLYFGTCGTGHVSCATIPWIMTIRVV